MSSVLIWKKFHSELLKKYSVYDEELTVSSGNHCNGLHCLFFQLLSSIELLCGGDTPIGDGLVEGHDG